MDKGFKTPLFGGIFSEQQTTKKFELNPVGNGLLKGEFSQPNNFKMANIQARDTAEECRDVYREFIKTEGTGVCLGYVQHNVRAKPDIDIEYNILTKAGIEKKREHGEGTYLDEYNVIEVQRSNHTEYYAARAKLKTKNESKKSLEDYTNLQNARLLTFDVDLNEDIQYNDTERKALSSIENYVELLNKLTPEVGFKDAAWIATVSTSAKVKTIYDPEKPFEELIQKGFHLTFFLDNETNGVQHKVFKQTLENRLFEYGLLRAVPSVTRYKDKIDEARKFNPSKPLHEILNEDEFKRVGLPSGTIHVRPEIVDMCVFDDVNRLIFEGNPDVPHGWTTHEDIIKEGGGSNFITFTGLPHESITDSDKKKVREFAIKEVLSRKWVRPDGYEYTDKEVEDHVAILDWEITKTKSEFTLSLSDMIRTKTVYKGSHDWSIDELITACKDEGDFQLLCEWKDERAAGRTVLFNWFKGKPSLWVPRDEIYYNLCADAEVQLYERENRAVNLLKQNVFKIDDTGSDYNIELVKGLKAKTCSKVVSAALHGTGKSTAMRAIVQDSDFFVAVAPLQSLVDNLVKDFSCDPVYDEEYKLIDKGIKVLDYRDIEKGADLSNYDGVVVCAPSVYKIIEYVKSLKQNRDQSLITPTLQRFLHNVPIKVKEQRFVLVIDEVERILKDVHKAPSLGDSAVIYQDPQRTLDILKDLVKLSDAFLLGDADANLATANFMVDTGETYLSHFNDSKKKEGATAYISRYNASGYKKVQSEIIKRINANVEKNVLTVLCSTSKKKLVSIFKSINDPKSALIVSEDKTKITDEKAAQERGNAFRKDPIGYIKNGCKLVGLSPAATNGFNIDIDGIKQLEGEVIYINDDIHYGHEIAIQHVLRLRGKRDIYCYLSTNVKQLNLDTNASEVLNSLINYKARSKSDIKFSSEMLERCAEYARELEEDGKQYYQRLFAYLKRVGFNLVENINYCIDVVDLKSIGSIDDYLNSNVKDIQKKWIKIVCPKVSKDSEYKKAMRRFWYSNLTNSNFNVDLSGYDHVPPRDVFIEAKKYLNQFKGKRIPSSAAREILIELETDPKYLCFYEEMKIKTLLGRQFLTSENVETSISVVELMTGKKIDDYSNPITCLRELLHYFGYKVNSKAELGKKKNNLVKINGSTVELTAEEKELLTKNGKLMTTHYTEDSDPKTNQKYIFTSKEVFEWVGVSDQSLLKVHFFGRDTEIKMPSIKQ
ncbi:hypothetical protein [Vibrio campbellii]|uniref:hypothetical protein n=1 Tax=Vibrio campbellii TaxID=680 RepID=UPI0005EF4ED0|nr:hypothetical protein [Vibrio campbellii]